MKQFSCKKLVQIVLTLGSWLTFSPLFYYMARKFRLLSKMWRVILLLVSPLFLIFYYCLMFIIPIGSYLIYDAYLIKYRFADNEVLERITDVPFPDVKIRKYYRGGRSFTGDFTDELVLQLEEVPNQEVIKRLDSLSSHKSLWKKNGNYYLYSAMWGAGDWAPKGEDKNEEMFLNVTYKEGSDSLQISYGRW